MEGGSTQESGTGVDSLLRYQFDGQTGSRCPSGYGLSFQGGAKSGKMITPPLPRRCCKYLASCQAQDSRDPFGHCIGPWCWSGSWDPFYTYWVMGQSGVLGEGPGCQRVGGTQEGQGSDRVTDFPVEEFKHMKK